VTAGTVLVVDERICHAPVGATAGAMVAS
jgi:hypothetical protein